VQTAAAQLFMARPYHAITMAAIAESAGFTRPNLYRYFSTKEEIFLSVLRADLERWMEDLRAQWPAKATSPATAGVELVERGELTGFVRQWVALIVQQPRLASLLPLLYPSLEQNSSEAVLRDFKLYMRDVVDELGRILSSPLPWLTEKGVAELVNTTVAIITGLMPMCTRGEMLNRVLQDLRLESFAVEFEPALRRTLELWFHGLAGEAR
jgi:AcrR family transcriptional regulator